ncbi:MAG: hypothetical protein Q8K38_05330 [Burkholderiaceae bacterium]|nr:hypothetical protein [Burkholderiaceae bacterium]MDZ4144844.1 hypothetical protein [Burkholderiales bacterium]
MAIGWMTVLQSVPWAEVIRNAPKVAEGARKLWNTVGKKTPEPKEVAPEVPANLPPEAQALARLEARIGALDAQVAQLQEQLMASSELIQALAEQNTQLVQRAEANRLRVAWLSRAVAIGGVVLLGWLLKTVL